jgi:hypothetical protein
VQVLGDGLQPHLKGLSASQVTRQALVCLHYTLGAGIEQGQADGFAG